MLSFFALFIIAGIYTIIYFIINYSIIGIITGIFVILFISYELYRMEKYRIIFQDNGIFVSDFKQDNRVQLQRKMFIEYKNITGINITRSINNSDDEYINAPSGFVGKSHLEIFCKEKQKKRIFFMYFSKKQKVEIIDEIKLRMKESNSNTVIPDSREFAKNVPKCSFETKE